MAIPQQGGRSDRLPLIITRRKEVQTMRTIRINKFSLLMVLLITFAWVALWVWGQSPYSRFLNHAQLDQVSFEGVGFILAYLAGWVLMTAAMMLPTSLPLIQLFYGITRRKPDQA